MGTSIRNQLVQAIEGLSNSPLAELLDSARRMNRGLLPAMRADSAE
jgi:hypothetical protein